MHDAEKATRRVRKPAVKPAVKRAERSRKTVSLDAELARRLAVLRPRSVATSRTLWPKRSSRFSAVSTGVIEDGAPERPQRGSPRDGSARRMTPRVRDWPRPCSGGTPHRSGVGRVPAGGCALRATVSVRQGARLGKIGQGDFGGTPHRSGVGRVPTGGCALRAGRSAAGLYDRTLHGRGPL